MTSNFDNLQASVDAANTNLEEIAGDLASQADKIQQLMDQIAGGLSADEAATVVTELEALRDRSRQIADIVNPDVPPAP